MKKIILVFYSVLFALACYSAPSAAFTRAWRNGAEELCFVAMGQEYEVNRGKWQPWGLQKIPSLRRCIF